MTFQLHTPDKDNWFSQFVVHGVVETSLIPHPNYVARLEADVQLLHDLQDQVDTLKDKVSALEETVDTHAEANQKLRTENNSLTVAKGEADNVVSQQGSALAEETKEAALAKLQKMRLVLAATNVNLSAKDAELKEARSAIAAKDAQLIELTDKEKTASEALATSNEAVQSLLTSQEEHDKDMAKIKSKLAVAEQSLVDMEVSLRRVKNDHDSVAHELMTTTQLQETTIKELEDLKAQTTKETDRIKKEVELQKEQNITLANEYKDAVEFDLFVACYHLYPDVSMVGRSGPYMANRLPSQGYGYTS